MKKFILIFFIFSIFITNLVFAENNNSQCFNFTKNITYRSSSSDVKDLQIFLKDKGFLNSNPTGFFGTVTLKALKDFQEKNGLGRSGNFGPLTRELIKKQTCLNTINEVNVSKNKTTKNETPSKVSKVDNSYLEEYQKYITTEIASHIKDKSALLGGHHEADSLKKVWGINGNDMSVWFLWGLSEKNLDRATDKIKNSNFNWGIDASLTGLDPSTKYYFKACVDNGSDKTICGKIKSFQTLALGTICPKNPEVSMEYDLDKNIIFNAKNQKLFTFKLTTKECPVLLSSLSFSEYHGKTQTGSNPERKSSSNIARYTNSPVLIDSNGKRFEGTNSAGGYYYFNINQHIPALTTKTFSFFANVSGSVGSKFNIDYVGYAGGTIIDIATWETIKSIPEEIQGRIITIVNSTDSIGASFKETIDNNSTENNVVFPSGCNSSQGFSETTGESCSI